jgi:SAM-dependent methyltransferase
MEFTGERYLPNTASAQMSYEHWHRYLVASQFVSGKTVLDIASGEGYGCDLLARTAIKVVGVDADPTAVEHASRTYGRANTEFHCGSVSNIPIEGRHNFDVIVSFETIEHVDEETQLAFLSEVKRLLKSDGLLLISTPNKKFYSDKSNYNNEFHKKEFYENQFLEFLSRSFRTVHLLGQKTFAGSYIWQPGMTTRECSEYQLDSVDGGFAPVQENCKELFYMIAVCSEGELDKVGNSILLDVSDNANRDSDEIRHTHARIQELGHKLQEVSAWAKRTAEEVVQRDRLIQDLRAHLQDRGVVQRQIERLESLSSTVEILVEATCVALQEKAPEFRKRLEYRRLVQRFCDVMRTSVPAGSLVAVVSSGDDDLLKVDKLRGWHFPQDPTGVHAGYNPANSADAIDHLETLRRRGAEYLVFPETSFWWLEHYAGFRGHLERTYRLIHRSPDTCAIYALNQSSLWSELAKLVSEFKSRHRRFPAILDWGSDFDLSRIFPECAIFSPVEPGIDELPYLDESIDVVAVRSDKSQRVREGRRVASEAVLTIASSSDGQSDPVISIESRENGNGRVRSQYSFSGKQARVE